LVCGQDLPKTPTTAFPRRNASSTHHEDLARKLTEFECKYDEKPRVVFDAIRRLMAPATGDQQRRQTGFPTKGDDRAFRDARIGDL
jgi:hypothetical protein